MSMSFLPVGVRKAIQTIEYGWTKPKAYVVLVPILSGWKDRPVVIDEIKFVPRGQS